jgi:hypothetical protein
MPTSTPPASPRRSLALALSILAITGTLACGSKPAPAPPPSPIQQLAGTFTFEPRLGTAFRHTLKKVDTFEIVGTPLRETEESELTLSVTITPEDNQYRYTLRPLNLRIVLNGAPVFDTPGGQADLSTSGAEIALLINGQAVVTSIRGAETLTKALVALAPPERREQVAQMYQPRAIEQLLVVRVVERTADLIGNHSNVGNSWGARQAAESGYDPVAKQLEVVGEADCAAPRCAVVSRKFNVDQRLIWQAAEGRVKQYVSSQGGDPNSVKVVKTDLLLEDELVVDPRTLEFHGARFEQKATITAQGPQGNMTVERSSVRTSTYDYAL